MSGKQISYGEAVRFGWETWKSNMGFFIGLMLIIGVISYIPSMIIMVISPDNVGASLIVNLASILLQILISMGAIKIALRFIDGDKPSFSDLFDSYNLILSVIGASILSSLLVLVGLILLVVPAIILSIQLQFFTYLIVDKGFGAIQSLKGSSAITKGAKFKLFLFSLLLFAINIAGFLALVIGMFVTIPLSMVAMAYVYRELLAQSELDSLVNVATVPATY